MNFYQSIAQWYNQIFPLEEPVKKFAAERLLANKCKILNIGCATGSLDFYLESLGYEVTGIDLDEGLLKQAYEEAQEIGSSVNLIQLDMKDISTLFAEKQFQHIFCFGNTLVHLASIKEFKDLLGAVYFHLKPGGSFLGQIVNYEKIIPKLPFSFPLIEKEQFRFARYYTARKDGRLNFKAILKVLSQNLNLVNEIPLFPLKQKELYALGEEAGFEELKFYGSPRGERYSPESPSVLFEFAR